MEQECKAVWSISEKFFWPALPGDALLRWQPPSPSLKRLSARKSESENGKKKKVKIGNVKVKIGELKVRMEPTPRHPDKRLSAWKSSAVLPHASLDVSSRLCLTASASGPSV